MNFYQFLKKNLDFSRYVLAPTIIDINNCAASLSHLSFRFWIKCILFI
jgi:hypothetical protein